MVTEKVDCQIADLNLDPEHTHTGTDGVLAQTGKCGHLPALTHPMAGCTSAPEP